MKHMVALSWFFEEKQQRREQMKQQDVSLINHQLQDLLHQVQHSIKDWKVYESMEDQLKREHRLVQSGLWRLQYANNFEIERVALAQGLLLSHILKREAAHEESKRWEDQLNSLMRRLGNVDESMYLLYTDQKDKI